MNQQEEDRRLKQIQRLNYFYAITVMFLAVVIMILLFIANAQQQEALEEFSKVAGELQIIVDRLKGLPY